MTRNKNAERLYFVDNIRGIAAILVLLSHTFEYFLDFWPKFYFENYNLGMIGVSAFFIISGFLIPLSLEKYESIKLFIVNRFFRIYPLYIFIFIISILLIKVGIINSWDSFMMNIFKNIFFNLLILQDYVPKKMAIINLVGSSWTLFIEFVWYGIFSLLFYLNLNKRFLALIIAPSIILITISLFSLILKIRIPIGHLVLLDLCFIGLFIYRFFTNLINTKTLTLGLLIAFVGISFSLYVAFYHYNNPMFSFRCVLISYILGSLIFAFFYIFNFSSKILSFLGKISYSVYLSHGVVLYLLNFYFHETGFNLVILTILLTLISSYFLYKIIEEPFVKMFKFFLTK